MVQDYLHQQYDGFLTHTAWLGIQGLCTDSAGVLGAFVCPMFASSRGSSVFDRLQSPVECQAGISLQARL